ncbi:MAG: DUF2188 domain-containing protein [Bdellovibrionota bacterium]
MLRTIAQIGLKGFISRFANGLSFISSYEVRPSHGDGWMIMQRGSSNPLRIFKKKSDAVREAKKLAREEHTRLNVFMRNGRVQTRLQFT